MKAIKRAAFVIALGTLLAGNAFADLSLNFGELEVTLPFVNTEAVSLYDVIGKKGFAGLETPVAAYRSLEGTVGAVTDSDLNGIPFFGVRKNVKAGLFKDSFYVGLWLGRDLRNDQWRGGFKASKKIWGPRPE